jgi:hypothetical protein
MVSKYLMRSDDIQVIPQYDLDTTNLVVTHESRESRSALHVENLDELCAEVGIHRREERARLYAVLNHR